MPKDPMTMVRFVAVFLFGFTGVAIIGVSSYLFIVHGELPPQLYNMLVGMLYAMFTLIGFHSNTLSNVLTYNAMRNNGEKDAKGSTGSSQTP